MGMDDTISIVSNKHYVKDDILLLIDSHNSDDAHVVCDKEFARQILT